MDELRGEGVGPCKTVGAATWNVFLNKTTLTSGEGRVESIEYLIDVLFLRIDNSREWFKPEAKLAYA